MLIKPKANGYLSSSESRTTENVDLKDYNFGVRAFVGVQLNREKFFITIKPMFSLSLVNLGKYMSEMNLTHFRLSVGIGF